MPNSAFFAFSLFNPFGILIRFYHSQLPRPIKGRGLLKAPFPDMVSEFAAGPAGPDVATRRLCSQPVLLRVFPGTGDCRRITGSLTRPAFCFRQDMPGRNMSVHFPAAKPRVRVTGNVHRPEGVQVHRPNPVIIAPVSTGVTDVLMDVMMPVVLVDPPALRTAL